MKKYAIIILSFFLCFTGRAQVLEEYIGTRDLSEVALDVKGLKDGGSVMVGYITRLKDGKYDYRQSDMLITRVDASGNVVWCKRMGIEGLADKLVRVVVARNGDFIAIGHAGLVPYFETGTAVGYAAIIRFDAATGNPIWQRYVRSTTSHNDPKGDVYEDVVELDDEQICAVGVRDFQPAYADGMITLFDPAGNVVWHRVVTGGGSSGFYAVTQHDNRIFTGGIFQGYSYYDMHIAEFDVAANPIWSNRYEYSVFNPYLGYNIDNDWVAEMHVVEKELKVSTNTTDAWTSTVNMGGILSLDINGGGVFGLHMFNDVPSPHTNLGAVEYVNNNDAYYVINPASNLIDPVYPSPWGSVVNLSDPVFTNIDPNSPGLMGTRQFLMNGAQYISGEDIFADNIHYAGLGVDDPMQIGQHDILYLKTQINLPSPDETRCPLIEPKMEIQSPEVPAEDYRMEMEEKIELRDIYLKPIDVDVAVVPVCQEAPCHVDDIKYCGSLAAPTTYDFSGVTTPAVANVIWDFGDGNTLATTSTTPVTHTYVSGGTYTVCLNILDIAGKVCDRKCITICVPDAAAKPANIQLQKTGAQLMKVDDIYPNPTDGTLNIPLKYDADGEVTIRVMSVEGVIVYDSKKSVTQGRQIINLDIKNLVPGNYLCEINDGKQKVTKVITKN